MLGPSRVVLVPRWSCDWLRGVPDGFRPLFYDYYAGGWAARIGRRFGWRPARLQIDAQAHELAPVSALWLDSAVMLSRQETAELLDRLPSLQWIYSQRTGFEHLPLDLYRARGVTVSRGDLSGVWVAEMNLACVLSHAKRLPDIWALNRARRTRTLTVRGLRQMQVVVVGTGIIGGHTARLCRAVGMEVLGASRQPERFAHIPHAYSAIVDLQTALRHDVARADAVILTVPLSDATRGLISREVLARMPPGAALVNLARPGLVDEQALITALRSGRLGAAWVTRLQGGLARRWRALGARGLHITGLSEAHVACKPERAFAQFIEFANAQARGEVRLRIA